MIRKQALIGARSLWVAMASIVSACGGAGTEYMGEHTPFAGCEHSPAAPPTTLGLASFYAKYLDGYGTPVVASAAVSDQALQIACRITGEVVSLRSDVRQALAANHFRVAVLAPTEVTTDIPEYADIYTTNPAKDWDSMRGIGATHARPVCSCGEENLLCLAGDVFAGASILIQMLAHGLRDLGIEEIDSQFDGEIRSAYAAAMARDAWQGTSAADDVKSYWASGAEAWFGANSRAPARGHAAVTAYDPALAALQAAYLPADDWRPGCY